MARTTYSVWQFEYSQYHLVESFSTVFNAIKYLYNIFSDNGTDDEYDVHDIDIKTCTTDKNLTGTMFRYRGLIYMLTVDKEYGYEEV